MNDYTELKVNCGLVIRGDVLAIKRIMQELERTISLEKNVIIVHKTVSAAKLWIKEGDQ